PGGAAEHPVWPRSRPARLDAPHLLTGASAATCDSGGAPLSRLMRRLGTARRIDGTAAGGVEPPADSQDALAPGRTWPHSTGEEWREAVCALDPAILRTSLHAQVRYREGRRVERNLRVGASV